EYCARFAGRYVKALRLTGEPALAALDRYGGDWVLVDADTPGYGGSGRRADVGVAKRAAARRRVGLAGGPTPANVAQAIGDIEPFGVDVCGGVERAPGVKDPAKVIAFVAAVRGARP